MEHIPDHVLEKISQVVEDGDYEYADNYRAARTNNAEELQAFDYAESRGCCGSHTETVTLEGEEWIIGFNYGH